ncbi:DNA cross-link repair protein SNM1 [Acorus gramineus]|uniref:DNA cross-link repair protein SNM1 n=1 Tax=Acorus gramineus TaxID=55184 RepID=A0AAV9AJS1_ACOGR|nr:DNA cross-link repair protein SNM1 [Acorus gramineus]
MASKPKTRPKSNPPEPALTLAMAMSEGGDDDDDFQDPSQAISLAQTLILSSLKNPTSRPLKPSNGTSRKKPRPNPSTGKENRELLPRVPPSKPRVPPKIGSERVNLSTANDEPARVPTREATVSDECGRDGGFKTGIGYYTGSIESRLMGSSLKNGGLDIEAGREEEDPGEIEPGTQLRELMNLCSEMNEEEISEPVVEDLMNCGDGRVECPLCGIDISDLTEELRHVHTNECLDKEVRIPTDEINPRSLKQAVDTSPVISFLSNLGLSRYEDAFMREEIDWDTLQWLTEEDLLTLGIVALGPRKKIVHALNDLRKANCNMHDVEMDVSQVRNNGNVGKVLPGNKLITEFFQGPATRNSVCSPRNVPPRVEGTNQVSAQKKAITRNKANSGKLKDIPPWCCVPGTPFRVDAFRYLGGDCSHWFLTHFHLDHYQGLTRSFSYGKIYCSEITAQLVNLKIGVSLDRLHVLPLNQKIRIAGTGVTCLDANHCPGSMILLFELPNGKTVLHTGDFRFCPEMVSDPVLRSCRLHTLILDTTYCNPQYDFPKQEAVIQFVIEAIQAEAFNPKTLFLIGSYTIGKERLFLEVARCLRKKVYVGAAKLRLLECLGFPKEDMQWFTVNEMESRIHVVPMWTIASFKRMKHLSNQYSGRYNLIVAFSPTGWTFGKGKKKSPCRRWQQGTIIRYEVPYSEHCSFTELKEFMRLVSPENIIPSVNNDGPASADAMVALLMSDS